MFPITDANVDIGQQVQMVEAQINEEIIGNQVKNIPKEVWQNRFTCVDYMLVLNRMVVTLATFP